jgi:hypothetical protein
MELRVHLPPVEGGKKGHSCQERPCISARYFLVNPLSALSLFLRNASCNLSRSLVCSPQVFNVFLVVP